MYQARGTRKVSPPTLSEELDDIEALIAEGDLDNAQKMLTPRFQGNPSHPRVLFALGALHFCNGRFKSSKNVFHQAALYGHPDAPLAEEHLAAIIMKEFWEQYPETYYHIQNGEPLRALTVLRGIRNEFPGRAGAALASCLREAGEMSEGVDVCEASLSRDPHQPAVFRHLWSYYTELVRDSDALDSSLRHLQQYPFSAEAYANAADSALLLDHPKEARWHILGHLIHTTDLNEAMNNLFKYYEQIREWDELCEQFDTLFSVFKEPSPQTLTLYGEALIEKGDFSNAFEVLERALRIAPEYTNAVLAYGRILAKSGKLDEAAKFVSTVMQSCTGTKTGPDWYLIISFLSELLRNGGDAAGALKFWTSDDNFCESLLDTVGPRPFVEYAYCLAETGSSRHALALCKLLSDMFPMLYIVAELEANLTSNAVM